MSDTFSLDPNSTSYTPAERALLDVHKDEYKNTVTPALRTKFLTTKVYDTLSNYWDQRGIKYDPQVQKTKLCKWARNTWRKPHVEGVVKPQSGLINVKKSDVISRTRKQEVEAEIDTILGPVDALNHSKRFNVRATAIGNIIAKLDPAELSQLEEEVKRISQQGHTLEVRRQLAEKNFEKRLDDSATANWRELGMLSITFTTFEDTSGRLHVEVHDRIAQLLNIQDAEDVKSFEEVHTANARGMQRLVLEYVRDMLNLSRGASKQVKPKDNILGKSEDGYPIILPTYNKEKLSRDDGERLCREYLSKHYELATSKRTSQVPWGDMKSDVHSFIRAEYLPPDYEFKDPHNNTAVMNALFLEHIAEQEKNFPASQVFRFHNVTSKRRQGSVIPSRYPDEVDGEGIPEVSDSRKRRKTHSVPSKDTIPTNNTVPTNTPSQSGIMDRSENTETETDGHYSDVNMFGEEFGNSEQSSVTDLYLPTHPNDGNAASFEEDIPFFRAEDLLLLNHMNQRHSFESTTMYNHSQLTPSLVEHTPNLVEHTPSLGEHTPSLGDGHTQSNGMPMANPMPTKFSWNAPPNGRELSFTEQLFGPDNQVRMSSLPASQAFPMIQPAGDVAAEPTQSNTQPRPMLVSPNKGGITTMPTQGIIIGNYNTAFNDHLVNISNNNLSNSYQIEASLPTKGIVDSGLPAQEGGTVNFQFVSVQPKQANTLVMPNVENESSGAGSGSNLPSASNKDVNHNTVHTSALANLGSASTSAIGGASLQGRPSASVGKNALNTTIVPKSRPHSNVTQASPSKIVKDILTDFPLSLPTHHQKSAVETVQPPKGKGKPVKKVAAKRNTTTEISESETSKGKKGHLTADDLAAQEAEKLKVEGKRTRKRKVLE